MNCRKIRIDLALLAGNDLDESSVRGLQRHLAGCPHCREHWLRMQSSLRALQTLRSGESEPASLWPGLATRLEDYDPRRAPQFNGWMPAALLLAACLVLLAVTFNHRPPERGGARAAAPFSREALRAHDYSIQQGFRGFEGDEREPLTAPTPPPYWNLIHPVDF